MDAISVELMLRRKNVNAHRIFFSELGHSQKLSLKLPENHLLLSDADHEDIEIKPDIVWLRRLRPPKPPIDLSSEDSAAVHTENVTSARAILHSATDETRVVNSIAGQGRSLSKSLQLSLAHKAGFSVPDTFISNQKSKILEFITKDDVPTIMKTFVQLRYFFNGDKPKPVYASKISETDLADEPEYLDQVSIFQKMIPKSHEIRALFLGSHVIAARIDAASYDGKSVDSRRPAADDAYGCHIELPPDIVAKGVSLMKSLGIVTAAFDLLVTPDGDYIFLELNEMGQSLYLEQYEGVPCVLEAYCQFLMHQGDFFDFAPDYDLLKTSSQDIYNEAQAVMRKESDTFFTTVSESNALRL